MPNHLEKCRRRIPLKGKIDRQRILEMLEKGLRDIDDIDNIPLRLKRHLHSAVYEWDSRVKPQYWYYEEQSKYLFVAADISERCGRIDVWEIVDVHATRWLASEQYRRRHFPRLPWDNQ